MDTIGKKMMVGLSLCWILLTATTAFAQDFSQARVSFDNGKSMVKGTDDADWSYTTINSLITPGDALWVDQDGTLEVEMSGGTFLRMADGSKAEITSLRPSDGVRVWNGSIYIQRLNRSNDDIFVETPVCKIAIARDSQVRVDVVGDGATTVSVRWGAANVRSVGANHDMTVSRGERTYIDPGYLPSPPDPFDLGVEDDFDSWNRERGRFIALGADKVPPAVVMKSVPIGVSDLGTYGEWVSIDNSYYWRPVVVADFVPYRNGHWSFVGGCGYVWVDDYPFAYVTSHYGRWWRNDHYGWVWTYRDEWGPAWVTSMRCGPNFVWAPLDPWDAPCSFGVDYYDFGGFRLSVGVSTYCVADDLLMGPCMVRPCTPVMFHGLPPAEVNIWNIYIGEGDHHRPPHHDDRFQVRDYSPRRVIRGPDAMGEGKAPDRVASLEGRGGAPMRWRAVEPGQMRNAPTVVNGPGRAAQPRSARIAHDVMQGGGQVAPRDIRGQNLPFKTVVTPPAAPERSRGGAASPRSESGTQSIPRSMRSRDVKELSGGGGRSEAGRNADQGSNEPARGGFGGRGSDDRRHVSEEPSTPNIGNSSGRADRSGSSQTREVAPDSGVKAPNAPSSVRGSSRATRQRVSEPASSDSGNRSTRGSERVNMPEAPTAPSVSAPTAPSRPTVTMRESERSRSRETRQAEQGVRSFSNSGKSNDRNTESVMRSEAAPKPMRIREASPRNDASSDRGNAPSARDNATTRNDAPNVSAPSSRLKSENSGSPRRSREINSSRERNDGR